MGTPALTTRGMREDAIRQVGEWIGAVLAAPEDHALASMTRDAIREFNRDYPVPADAKAGQMALA